MAETKADKKQSGVYEDGANDPGTAEANPTGVSVTDGQPMPRQVGGIVEQDRPLTIDEVKARRDEIEKASGDATTDPAEAAGHPDRGKG